MKYLLLPLLVVFGHLPCSGAAVTPFGVDAPVAPKQIKPLKPKQLALDCLSPAKVALWTVEPPSVAGEPVFSIRQENGSDILNIRAGRLDPSKTTVRILLPGDGPENGAIWQKNFANYVSFLCRANKPVEMTMHLLQRGKPAGTYQSRFLVQPGEWQRVILPVSSFKLKSLSSIAGLGFRVVSSDKDAEVSIKDITVAGMPYTEDSWKSQKLQISLSGDWLFAPDPGDRGLTEKWFEKTFDDSQWAVLKSGQDWQSQGVEFHGFGWYRQQVFIPKEFQGIPLKITLCPIPSDDDVWFNGQRIGGWRGEYKYNNWLTRTYTVPPSLIQYGENNRIALRIWGGNISFIGNKSGLIKGPLVAELDPYAPGFREPGGTAVDADLFDLSDARAGHPFEVLLSFPAELAKDGNAKLTWRLTDTAGEDLAVGTSPLKASPTGPATAVVPVDSETSRKIYLRGRFNAALLIEDASGTPVYAGMKVFDRLSFLKRDAEALPPLKDQYEETPYGRLRLIDEIDSATPIAEDPHPYLQSGFTKDQERMPPGSDVGVKVSDILGKKARESDYGWFAYRIGRGKLKPRSTYLLRIEYPEDKPRFVPLEIQTGQNFMDVGWKNGVGAGDVYDPWPLSKKWQWYDVIVPLDDETTGTGGTGTADAENGFWVYFMNKLKPDQYYGMWSGGPAIGKIKLFEIDPEKNAPANRLPEGLPHRVLSFDWERQPDHNPEDLVKYAKLMGYTAISPVIIKWAFMNFSDPLNGYTTVAVDDRNYWSNKPYDPAAGGHASSPVPGKDSQHVRYLKATKEWGIDYIPRFEWGGSQDLPKEAWAVDGSGQPIKPNRFAQWGSNLLNPLTWDDLKKLMDHMIKPYVQDNPQLAGVLWRIRCDRVPISYGPADLELFSKETNTPLPPGGDAQRAAWAAGEMKTKYDDWWHQKRTQFHARLAELLQSYRPGLKLYYYNWDGDKFGLIKPDITTWAFVSNVVKPPPDGGKAAYEKERAVRKTFTAEDYISVMKSGNFGDASKGINRADYGIRPELYKGIKGIQIFAPANYLCYADKPDYLNYFQTDDGLAVSNVVSYDEIGSRSINPKYEGNMITPGGPAFSMALELLAWFHGDAQTLNYTVYTYGRGFADAHRRFAQAFLALPAIKGTILDQGDPDVKVRLYPSDRGTYVGVAYKGFEPKKLQIRIPGKAGAKLRDLVTNTLVSTTDSGNDLQFVIESGPMELNAYKLE